LALFQIREYVSLSRDRSWAGRKTGRTHVHEDDRELVLLDLVDGLLTIVDRVDDELCHRESSAKV